MQHPKFQDIKEGLVLLGKGDKIHPKFLCPFNEKHIKRIRKQTKKEKKKKKRKAIIEAALKDLQMKWKKRTSASESPSNTQSMMPVVRN